MNKECSREKCRLWYKTDRKKGSCSIRIIAENIDMLGHQFELCAGVLSVKK